MKTYLNRSTARLRQVEIVVDHIKNDGTPIIQRYVWRSLSARSLSLREYMRSQRQTYLRPTGVWRWHPRIEFFSLTVQVPTNRLAFILMTWRTKMIWRYSFWYILILTVTNRFIQSAPLFFFFLHNTVDRWHVRIRYEATCKTPYQVHIKWHNVVWS
jgi:hypothetical protein